MKLTTMIYVSDMQRSIAFYETLGLTRDHDGEIDKNWNGFPVGDGTLALHIHENGSMPEIGGRADLTLVVPVDGSLDRVHQVCRDRGIEFGAETQDDGFGRFFWVKDPDGYPVTINEQA